MSSSNFVVVAFDPYEEFGEICSMYGPQPTLHQAEELMRQLKSDFREYRKFLVYEVEGKPQKLNRLADAIADCCPNLLPIAGCVKGAEKILNINPRSEVAKQIVSACIHARSMEKAIGTFNYHALWDSITDLVEKTEGHWNNSITPMP